MTFVENYVNKMWIKFRNIGQFVNKPVEKL